MLWKVKLAMKVMSGRYPALKRFYRKIGYNRHGRMNVPEYAIGVFSRHFHCFAGTSERPENGTCLEIGPGEALATALTARAHGFRRTILIDSGYQARGGSEVYRALAGALRRQGRDIPVIEPGWTSEKVLLAFNAEYLTDGLASLASLPDGSVDFSFSHAVLEHLPRAEASRWLRELRRVTRPEGVSSHVIDLRDHLGGLTNHLRFPADFWEGEAIRKSGIYTNRLRCSDWLREFAAAEWRVEVIERHEKGPAPRREKLDPMFRDLTESDLRVHGIHAVLRPA